MALPTTFFVLLMLAALLLTTAAEAAPAASPMPPPREYTLAGPLATKQAAGPDWAKNLPLYQAYPQDGMGQTYAPGNFSRDYVPGSYFRRTEALLPALKEMGVGVVWLPPVHPRGPAAGAVPPPHISPTAIFHSDSVYCVRDYYAIDPHWGSPAEFKHLVHQAHALGMHVMMDMVLNHTSWGSPLLVQHPEFYKRDKDGTIQQAGPWRDIAQLDYGNHTVWEYMRQMLLHWMRDYEVDGFRMDAVSLMPTEFWPWLRPQLLAVKPILLLAEDDNPRDHPAFDMSYNASLYQVFWGLAGNGLDDLPVDATALDALLLKQAHEYPAGAVLMNHLDNHDLSPEANPWAWGYGPVKKRVSGSAVLVRYGAGYRAFSVLAATLPGRPMVYNGQELWTPGALNPPPVPTTPEKLRAAPNYDFYRRLLNAYRTHPALYEGAFTKMPSGHDETIYSFLRVHGNDKVLVIVNLSPAPQTASLHNARMPGRYQEIFTGKEALFTGKAEMTLEPWGYRVYVR